MEALKMKFRGNFERIVSTRMSACETRGFDPDREDREPCHEDRYSRQEKLTAITSLFTPHLVLKYFLSLLDV